MSGIPRHSQIEGLRAVALYLYRQERAERMKGKDAARKAAQIRLLDMCLPRLKREVPIAIKWATNEYGR